VRAQLKNFKLTYAKALIVDIRCGWDSIIYALSGLDVRNNRPIDPPRGLTGGHTRPRSRQARARFTLSIDHVLLFLTAGTNRTAHHVVVLITVSRFADFVLSCVWMFQFLESVLLTELGKVDRRVMF
jgi:hypothetical protein